MYQAITTVQIGDGKNTLFWLDVWVGDEALAERFPVLFSHCKSKEETVHHALESNPEGAFVNPLSSQALGELNSVCSISASVSLNDNADKRLSPFCLGNSKLDSGGIYKLLKARGGALDDRSAFIWKNAAPPRVQLFIWLLTQRRIQCRSNLFKKHIVDSPTCEVCGQ